jgi:hypothetical protein
MERTIRTRRVYQLAPYHSFEVEDVIGNMPEGMMFDNVIIKKIKFLQLVEVELQYYKYIELVKQADALPEDERIKYLKELKTNVSNELNTYLFSTPIEKET